MKILILGGTVFVGRHIAELAIARGHDVTVFHRGSKGLGIVAGAAEILGDRNADLSALADQSWDAVIDTCAYVPRAVTHSGLSLSSATRRYIFISTISVFDFDERGTAFVGSHPTVQTEDVTAETYGALKIECEQALAAIFGERLTVVRPGLVAGPYDPTNRFTYWVERFANCNSVLVPDQLDQAIALIDARDLANETLDLVEKELSGSFTAVGERRTLGDVMDACNALRPQTRRFLFDPAESDATLGAELPLVLGRTEGKPWKYEMEPLFWLSPTRPLTYRSLEETTRDTLAWSLNRDRSVPDRAGMTRKREVEIMDAIAAAREAR